MVGSAYCNHVFEPRYDTRLPKDSSSISFWGGPEAEIPLEKIYVCDVCTKCGLSTTPPSRPR